MGLIDKKQRGSIFFVQERVGLGGKVFKLIKLRTMAEKKYWKSIGFDPTKESWTMENDPRVTKFGKILRKSRIDELPQIVNVIKGDMSFVGPRPESREYVALLTKKIQFYYLRHSVLPGITGWAQVKYPYGSNINDSINKLEYDLFYVKNRNLILDIVIILRTLKVIIFGKGR